MRALIDITDDTGEYGGSGVPSPASLQMDGDEIVVQFREVEWRMTYEQFLVLVEAMRAWLFRSNHGDHRDCDLDSEDVLASTAEEHWHLRTIVTEMLGGALGDVEIDETVRRALRKALRSSEVRHNKWETLDDRVKELEAENASLRERILKSKR